MRLQRLGSQSPSSTLSSAPISRIRLHPRRSQCMLFEDSFDFKASMNCEASWTGFGWGFKFQKVPSMDYFLHFRLRQSSDTRFHSAGKSIGRRHLVRLNRLLLFLALFLQAAERLHLRLTALCLQRRCDYFLRFHLLHFPPSFQLSGVLGTP